MKNNNQSNIVMNAKSCSSYGSVGRLKCLSSFVLQEHYSHEHPFNWCGFDESGKRIYLIDTAGRLVCVNLGKKSFSTYTAHSVSAVSIHNNNPLSLLVVTTHKELLQVSLQSSISVKIMNLNMGKILAFEHNYLRDILLILDSKILMLCDVKTKKCASLKANYREIFSFAAFASHNRLIFLAVKLATIRQEIRILEIHSLKTIHLFKIPYFQNIKIQTSYNYESIVIYGDTANVSIVNIKENNPTAMKYESFVLPLHNVRNVKIMQNDDILLLGSDQTIYQIKDRTISPLSNFQQHIRLHSFDISSNNKLLVLLSNRTVYTFPLPKAIQFTQLKEFQQQSYFYSEEQKEKQAEITNVITQYIPNNNLINLPQIKDKIQTYLIEEIQELSGNEVLKCHIQQIYFYLYDNIKPNDILQFYRKEVISMIKNILSLTKLHFGIEICYFLLNNISLSLPRVQSLALFFISDHLFTVTVKHFNDCFLKDAITLFNKQKLSHLHLINILLKYAMKKDFLIAFLLKVWEGLKQGKIDLQKIQRNVISMLDSEAYKRHCEREVLAKESGKAIDSLLKISEEYEDEYVQEMESVMKRQKQEKRSKMG